MCGDEAMSEIEMLVRHLRRIEVDYGIDGWHGDEGPPPQLYVLFDKGGPFRLPLDFNQWPPDTPPGAILTAIARGLPTNPHYQEIAELIAETQWYGLGFAFEAWSVQVRGDEAADQRTEWLSEQRLLHLHPDRVSIRGAFGVTRTQHRAAVMRLENEPTEITTWTTDDEGPTHTGAVINGMVALVAGLDAMMLTVR
jgi:hypothetical protein